MKLKDYKGKRIRAVVVNGDIYIGKVILFTPATDNEINEDAIALDTGWWLDESDIKTIEIIND
jgi:hypothetical protein